MTVPDRRTAAALLLGLHPPAWHVRHARAVAEVAGWLALRAAERGQVVDRRLAETAALLHDVDKILPRGDPARKLRHGEGSAAWLERNGHPELAPVVFAHSVTRLVDGLPASGAAAGLEARIVAYADKRAGQHLEPMVSRFASWDRRYPGTWDAATIALVHERAATLEAEVCAAAGVRPEQVRRLAWTAAAFRQARSGVEGPRSSARGSRSNAARGPRSSAGGPR